MAVALGLPVLAVRAGCAAHGVFELGPQSGLASADRDGGADELSAAVRNWAATLPIDAD